jgi:hypothetical protein
MKFISHAAFFYSHPFSNQVANSDQNMIQRLIKDVVSGGLRRRRGAMNDGYELDYYDTFDDMDDNLVALRQAAAAKRRKLLNGNILQAIGKQNAHCIKRK